MEWEKKIEHRQSKRCYGTPSYFVVMLARLYRRAEKRQRAKHRMLTKSQPRAETRQPEPPDWSGGGRHRKLWIKRGRTRQGRRDTKEQQQQQINWWRPEKATQRRVLHCPLRHLFSLNPSPLSHSAAGRGIISEICRRTLLLFNLHFLLVNCAQFSKLKHYIFFLYVILLPG